MALRNGPKSKMLGANSRKSSLFRFGIPGVPNIFFYLTFSFKLLSSSMEKKVVTEGM